MLSKNAVATNVDSNPPADTPLTMVEEKHRLDRMELREFLKMCPGLSAEDKKTLLSHFFLTNNKKDGSGELDAKILKIWNEIDKKLNPAPRNKCICRMVKDLPELWRRPYRKWMGREVPDGNERDSNLKIQNNSSNKICIYRLEQTFTYIKVTSKVSKNSGETLHLIVDTNATVNVIKADVIDPRMVIISKEPVELYGIIGNELAKSLGTCTIPMYHEEKKFRVEFKIARQIKSLPFDGVLGRNFFDEHDVSMDNEKQEIILKHEGWAIPFFSHTEPYSQKTIIPALSEGKVQIMVKHTEMPKGYLPQCEITTGIFLRRNVIKKSKTARITATIRNVHNFDESVEAFCIELLPLPKYVEKDWAIVEKNMKHPAFKELEAKYEFFVNNLESMEEYPQLHVHEFNPKKHTPNVLFCSMNINEIRVYSKIVNTVYKSYMAKPPGLHKVTKHFSRAMTTYLCTDRYLNIEEPSTKDSFFTLYNLKKKLLKERYSGGICILELNRRRKETPRALFFKMIQHIFEETDIYPLVVVRTIRTPKTEEEKMKAIDENHISKTNRHLGFVQTYNHLRDGYTWSTMKEDVMKYMMRCQRCKSRLVQYSALQNVLPPEAFRKVEPSINEQSTAG